MKYIIRENILHLWLFLIFGFTAALFPSAVFSEYTEGIEAYRKAWAAYATQRFEEAQDWVERSLRADPQNAHAWALQGDLYYLRHDLTAAKGFWERAAALNLQLAGPLGGQVAQVEMEMELEEQMRQASWSSSGLTGGSDSRPRSGRGQAFRGNDSGLVIRVPEGLPPEQERAILRELSQAMALLEPYFQYRMERPLTVLIYSPEAFYGSTHLPTEVLGLFDGKIRVPVGRAAVEQGQPEDKGSRRAGFTADFSSSAEVTAVLWHEYTHAVVYDVSHGKAPRWLQEGLAQVAERAAEGPALRLPVSSSAEVTAELPPLRVLLGIAERPGETVVMPAGQFYAASESLVQDLLETRGWDRMRLFLKALGDGRSVEEALQAVYGWDLKTLERKWERGRL